MMFTWGLNLKGLCSLLPLKAKRKFFFFFLILLILVLDFGTNLCKTD
jgi:hypothetical protein